MPPNLESLYADRMRWIRGSDVRELLRYAQDTSVISLAGGLPSPEAFPVEDLGLIFEELLHEASTPALQYGPTGGDPLLKKALVRVLRSRGIDSEPDRILVTHGAQQALELFGRVMLNPGNIGLVAQPTYLGIFTAMTAYHPVYHGIVSDRDGIRTDVLQEALEAFSMDGIRPKFIYVVSSFHNPTGVTMSARRRRDLANLAAAYEVPVIEDDPYYDLRFEGEPLRPVAGYDRDGWVLYVGSFSKVLAPAFRIGFVHGPAELLAKMSLAKQGVDLFTNGFGQRVAERYLTLGLMGKHIPKIRAIYRRKRDVMLRALEESAPDGMEWTHPDGGMFLWATTDPSIDTKELLPRAASKGVVYVPGHSFYAGTPERNHMRLNFSFPSDGQIRKAVALLGDTLKEALAGPLAPVLKDDSRRALVERGELRLA